MQERFIVIDAVIEADDGCQSPLADLMRKTQLASKQEAGCLTYRFTRDLDDASLFYAFEVWESEKALLEHLAAVPFKLFAAGLPDYGRLVSSQRRIGAMDPYDIPRLKGPAA